MMGSEPSSEFFFAFLIWRFPKSCGYPPNHPFYFRCSMINHQFLVTTVSETTKKIIFGCVQKWLKHPFFAGIFSSLALDYDEEIPSPTSPICGLSRFPHLQKQCHQQKNTHDPNTTKKKDPAIFFSKTSADSPLISMMSSAKFQIFVEIHHFWLGAFLLPSQTHHGHPWVLSGFVWVCRVPHFIPWLIIIFTIQTAISGV